MAAPHSPPNSPPVLPASLTSQSLDMDVFRSSADPIPWAGSTDSHMSSAIPVPISESCDKVGDRGSSMTMMCVSLQDTSITRESSAGKHWGPDSLRFPDKMLISTDKHERAKSQQAQMRAGSSELPGFLFGIHSLVWIFQSCLRHA